MEKTKELRVLRALPEIGSSADASKCKFLDLGQGLNWQELQELLRTTRGLPLVGPGGVAQPVLRQEARRHGFNMCIRVPAALHRKSLNSEDWSITTEEEWQRFMSQVPSNASEALCLVKEYSILRMGSTAYTTSLTGWHMMWEVAVSSTCESAGLVWGGHEVKLLIQALADSLQVQDSAEGRLGKATSGACAAAALWWLLCQPKAHLHLGSSASPGIANNAAGQSKEAIHSASELQLRLNIPGNEDLHAAPSLPQVTSGHARGSKPIPQLLAEGLHPMNLQVVMACPLPHHLLHCLLSSGLLHVCCAKLKELSKVLSGSKAKSDKLKASYRRHHAAVAAAWSTGVLSQALHIPFVQSTLLASCVDELLKERSNTRRHIQQQQQCTMELEDPDGKLISPFSQMAGKGRMQAQSNRMSMQLQLSHKSLKNQSTVEGQEADGQHATSVTSPAFALLGIESPTALWSSLAAAASLPRWLFARPPPHRLSPMTWLEALSKIQTAYKVRVSRLKWLRLKEQLMQASHNARGARALKKAILPGQGLSKEDLEAGLIAAERLAALASPPDQEAHLAQSVTAYFEYRADNHAGVCAAEALLHLLLVESSSMSVENENGVTEAVYPLRAHFLLAADTKLLLKLIDIGLPMRSQHIGACILSLFFYNPQLDLEKSSHSRPRAQHLDVHDLLPCLHNLVVLEHTELVARYGLTMLGIDSAEKEYAASLKRPGAPFGLDKGMAAFRSPQHPSSTHHPPPRQSVTVNVGKAGGGRLRSVLSRRHEGTFMKRRTTTGTPSAPSADFGAPVDCVLSAPLGGSASSLDSLPSLLGPFPERLTRSQTDIPDTEGPGEAHHGLERVDSEASNGTQTSSIGWALEPSCSSLPPISELPAESQLGSTSGQADTLGRVDPQRVGHNTHTVDAASGVPSAASTRLNVPHTHPTGTTLSAVGFGFAAAGSMVIPPTLDGSLIPVSSQALWPSDETPIELPPRTKDGLYQTLPDGSLAGGPHVLHTCIAKTAEAAAKAAEAARAEKDAKRAKDGGTQVHMAPHVKVPLKDLRWRSQGSEVSVHAAVCCWGCAHVVAEQESAKEQQQQEQQQLLVLGLGRPGKGKGPFTFGASVRARGSSPFLDQQEKTTLLLMQMLSSGIKSPCNGPAAHLLSASLVVMAYRPAAVPMLLKLGLIDAGDQKVCPGKQVGKTKKQAASTLSQERWGCLNPDLRPGGLMSLMALTHRSAHAQCTIALIACVALANTDPAPGVPPAPAWITSAYQEMHRAAAWKRAAMQYRKQPNLMSQYSSESHSIESVSIEDAEDEDDRAMKIMERNGVDGRLRLLRAGAWPLLQTCRDACEPDPSLEVQQGLAIAFMYLSQEIEKCYLKILATPKSCAPSMAGGSKGGSKDAADDESASGSQVETERVESDADSEQQAENARHANLAPLYRLLLAGKYATIEEAVKPLCGLVHPGDGLPTNDETSSRLSGILTFASLAVYNLAAVPGLREPLGESGAVQSLVDIVRRWVDLSLSEQRGQKKTAESALATLTRLMQGPEGSKNIMRFSAAWKTGSKEAVARKLLRGFGYPEQSLLDAAPSKTYRGTADVIGATSWQAWGRGSKQGTAHVHAIEEQQPLGASGQWHQQDSARDIAAVDQLIASPAQPGTGQLGLLHSTLQGQDDALTRKVSRAQEEADLSLRSSSLRGSQARSKPQKDDKYAALVGDSRSALDPIQLMVQVVDIRTRQRSRYLQIKLHALLALKLVAQVSDNRERLVESGAGPQLSKLAVDPDYDSRTRAAAGALWLEISHSPEGHSPLWWSCVMQDSGNDPPSSDAAPDDKAGERHTCVNAQMRMCFRMLQSREPETELVGANHSASLLCEGDEAKQLFCESGGLCALVSVASCSSTSLAVLAPVCTALLNLSSYIPIQVEMCNKVLRLLLHINSKYGRLNGYKETNSCISGTESVTSSVSSVSPSFTSLARIRQAQEQDQGYIKSVLYCSSGCLWNLSRNPGNRDLLYLTELEVKSRQAMVDVLERGTVPGTPSKGTLHFGGPPPNAKGVPLDAHAEALLHKLLAEPLMYEEENHARADAGAAFDTDSVAGALTRVPSGLKNNASPRRASSSGTGSVTLGVRKSSGFSTLTKSRAPSHSEWQDGLSDVCSRPSEDGLGASDPPRLATLQHRLQAPRASMFAPLSVDNHNAPAAPLFAMKIPQALPGDQHGLGAGIKVGVEHGASTGNRGFTHPTTSHAVTEQVTRGNKADSTHNASAGPNPIACETTRTKQQHRQQQEDEGLQRQHHLRSAEAAPLEEEEGLQRQHPVQQQRQRQQRHRLQQGVLSGSTSLRPHTAPHTGDSSRWCPEVGSLTLYPPTIPQPFDPEQAAREARPAFAKARERAAAAAAASSLTPRCSAYSENDRIAKYSAFSTNGLAHHERISSPSPSQPPHQKAHANSTHRQVHTHHSHGAQFKTHWGAEPGAQGAADVHLVFQPRNQHVHVCNVQPPPTVSHTHAHGAAHTRAGRHARTRPRSAADTTAGAGAVAYAAAQCPERDWGMVQDGCGTSMADACQAVLQQMEGSFAVPHNRSNSPSLASSPIPSASQLTIPGHPSSFTAHPSASTPAWAGGRPGSTNIGSTNTGSTNIGIIQKSPVTRWVPSLDLSNLTSMPQQQLLQQHPGQLQQQQVVGSTWQEQELQQKKLEVSQQQQQRRQPLQHQPDGHYTGMGPRAHSLLKKSWRDVPAGRLSLEQKALKDFEVPGAAVWPSVEGARVGQSLFKKYTPDNASHNGDGIQSVYVYRYRKTRVDEMPPPCNTAASASFDFGCCLGLEGIDELARELLKPWTELPFQPVMPKLEVPRPPSPADTLLPDLGSLSTLDTILMPKPAPPGGQAEGAASTGGSGWTLEGSVFAHRPHECQSKDFYDREHVVQSAMEQDMLRCCQKKRFLKILDKWAPEGPVRDELQAELKKHYNTMLRIFDWYACVGSGDPFSIQIVAWGQLMNDTKIADDKSKGCKLSDLDRVFLATNLEESNAEADKINLDNSLMRFEFLEAILRVTVIKFFESRPGGKQKAKPEKQDSKLKTAPELLPEPSSAAVNSGLPPLKYLPKPVTLGEAFSRLVDYYLLPNVPPEALHDVNAWRKERMYHEDVDILLKVHQPVLRALFTHYSRLMAGNDQNLLDLPEWMEMLNESNMMRQCRELTVREGKLAFIWSRMRFMDDTENLKVLQRSRALTYVEFLDALCHIADMISPPPVDELLTIGCSGHHPTTHYFTQVAPEMGALPRRDSAELIAPKTRPLDEKLEQVLELMIDNLMVKHNARNTANLIERLKLGRGRGYNLGKSGM